MFTQITKGLSESIDKALAKHAPQNLSHQNITKPAQNLASQSLAPQTQTRQALTRFGNELAQNPQTKPTQAVFDFDFIARDKTPEIPKQNAQIFPSSAQADKGGGLFDLPSQAKQKDEALQNLQHAPAQSHTTQAQNLAPHTPQSQSLQARYDTLHDFANKMGEHKESLSHEAKSLYDSFAKSLDSLSAESLSAKELNATDRHLSEYLVRTELAQVSNAKDIVLPYFSAKYQAKNEAELAQTFGSEKLAQMRQALQESTHTNPLAEFGTNYAEFYQDGKGAIAKLISEANAAKEAGQDFSGQVAGAFSKEIDGAEANIDLVWGNEKMGLQKIAQKHLDDFANFSGATPQEKLANGLSEIVSKGEVVEKDGVKTIWLKRDDKNYVVGLSKGWKGDGENLWIITSYEKTKGHIPNLRGNNLNLSAYKAEFNPLLTSSDEPLSDEIIQKISQKFNKDEKFAKNLYEWHKDSHPITKEADGTPKVFYHGNKDNDMSFEIFKPYSSPDTSKKAVFFSANRKVAQSYAGKENDKKPKNPKVFEVFLQIKNPLVIDYEGQAYAFASQQEMADKIFKGEVYFDLAVDKALAKGNHDGIIFKNIKDNRYGGGDKISDTFVVFDSNQIKAVGNKGAFDGTNPNIYHSSSTAGGGVLGGSIAGVERDEEGNIVGFSTEKFALGFASGAAGAKALSKIANSKHAQNLANTITQNRASQNLANSKIAQNLTNSKTLQMLAKKARTNPRAKAILEKIHIKSDIIPALEKGEQVKEADIIKALESSPQKGQEMLIIGKQNLSEGVLEWAKNNNKKIAVDILPEQKAKELGFRYPKVKRTISASEINHTLRRHGKNSPLIKKRMQEPITLEKIKKWTQYADEADYQTISTDNLGVEVLLSGKQINGYYVIIESIRKGANELAFKTMYFEKGNILKHKNFKQFDKNGSGATNGKTAPSHQVTSPPLN